MLALLWVAFSLMLFFRGGWWLSVGRAEVGQLVREPPLMARTDAFAILGRIGPYVLAPGVVDGIGFGLLVLGVVGLAAGWGLWQREPWARIVALILGVIALIHFPIGTALGIYTLWVLLPNDAAAEYARAARPI